MYCILFNAMFHCFFIQREFFLLNIYYKTIIFKKNICIHNFSCFVLKKINVDKVCLIVGAFFLKIFKIFEKMKQKN